MSIRKVVDIIFKARGVRDLEKGIDKTADAADKLDRKTSNVSASMLKMVGSVASIASVMAVLQVFREEMEKIDQITRQTSASFVELQGLDPANAVRNERASQSFARQVGRPDTEVGPAFFNFLSSTGKALSDDFGLQQNLFKEVVEAGKLSDPSIDLGVIAQLFGTAVSLEGAETPEDFQRIGNIIRQTAVTGKLDAGRVGQFFPRVQKLLTSENAGGLSFAQASGLFAAASAQTANTAEATTGLGTLMRVGLANPKIREKFGLSRNPIEAIRTLQRRGSLSLDEAKEIAGEGSALLIAFVENPRVFEGSIADVVAAGETFTDLDEEAFATLNEESDLFREGFRSRVADVGLEQRFVKPKALSRGSQIKERELSLEGTNAFSRLVIRKAGELERLLGGDELSIFKTQEAFRLFFAPGSEGLDPAGPAVDAIFGDGGAGGNTTINNNGGIIVQNGGVNNSERVEEFRADGGSGPIKDGRRE
jgi:hypothetical protein